MVTRSITDLLHVASIIAFILLLVFSAAPAVAQGPGSTPTRAPAATSTVSPAPAQAPIITPTPAQAPNASTAPAQERTPYHPQEKKMEAPPPLQIPAPRHSFPDVPITPITAGEAARLALLHQPSITVARANVMTANAKVQQVGAALNPSLLTNAQYTGATLPTAPLVGIGGSGSTTAGLPPAFLGYQMSTTANQLIFDFNHTVEQVRRSRSKAESAAFSLTTAESTLVIQVKFAYYTFVQNTRLVTVNEKDLETQQAHLELAQERYNAGVGLPSDVVRAQAAVSQSIFNLTQARTNESVSRVNLATLIGVDPRTPLTGSDEEEPVTDISVPETLYQEAHYNRPEIKQAQADVDAAEHQLRAAYSTNAPAFSGQAGWSSRGNQLPPAGSYFSTGLVMQFYLYDGGLTSGLVKEALAGRMSALASLEIAKQNIRSEVSQSYVNLVAAEQKLNAAKAGEASAAEALRLNEGRYKAGVGTFIDVLDAQNALLQARTNAVNARSAYDQSKAALSYSIGKALQK
jgi:outer membrane protein